MDKSRIDEMKGRIKEAAGDLTGNAELKNEGQADRVSGKLKKGIEAIAERSSDAVESIRTRIKR